MLTELEKCWLWAAMHHKDFSKCSITLYKPLINLGIHFGTYGGEYFAFRIGLGIPEVMIDIPFHIVRDYTDSMKKQGIEVKFESIIEDIPF